MIYSKINKIITKKCYKNLKMFCAIIIELANVVILVFTYLQNTRFRFYYKTLTQ